MLSPEQNLLRPGLTDGGICPWSGSGTTCLPSLALSKRNTMEPTPAHTNSCDVSVSWPCTEWPKTVCWLRPKSFSICTHPGMTIWNSVLPCPKTICPNKERVPNLVRGTDKQPQQPWARATPIPSCPAVMWTQDSMGYSAGQGTTRQA